MSSQQAQQADSLQEGLVSEQGWTEVHGTTQSIREIASADINLDAYCYSRESVVSSSTFSCDTDLSSTIE